MNIELNDEVNAILERWAYVAQRNRPWVDVEEYRERVFGELVELMTHVDEDDIKDAMDDAVAGIHRTRIWITN